MQRESFLTKQVGGERKAVGISLERAQFISGSGMGRKLMESYSLKGIERDRTDAKAARTNFETSHNAPLSPEATAELDSIDAEMEQAWGDFENEAAPYIYGEAPTSETTTTQEESGAPTEEPPQAIFSDFHAYHEQLNNAKSSEHVAETLSSVQDEAAKKEEKPLEAGSVSGSVAEHEANTPPIQQLERASPYSETTKTAERFTELGYKSEAVKIPGSNAFPEAIIFEREDTGEKMVRVYRGINAVDDSVLSQSSYALRTDEGKTVRTADSLKDSVRALAEKPSYATLKAYVDQAAPLLNHKHREQLDTEFSEVKERIMNGTDARTALVFGNVAHQGGYHADRGITPYVSASYSPVEAAGYGQKGVMVIDIPLSELEDFSADTAGEVNIKSDINPKYISAVLMHTSDREARNRPLTDEDFKTALDALDSSIKVSHYEPSELAEARSEHILARKEQAEVQLIEDREQLRQERSAFLQKRFAKDVDFSAISQVDARTGEQLDAYTATQRHIYDSYAKRLSALGRSPEEYSYRSTSVGAALPEYKEYDRATITDGALRQLLERVEDEEHRAREREARRANSTE